jgi:hypothetical protein
MAVRDFVTIYILGYVCFEEDLVQTKPVGPEKMRAVAASIGTALLGTVAVRDEHPTSSFFLPPGPVPNPDGEWPTIVPLKKELDVLRATRVTFGYHGHRFMLCVELRVSETETPYEDFNHLRHDVADLHVAVRQKLNTAGDLHMTDSNVYRGTPSPPYKLDSPLRRHEITHIYTYPLVLIPDGITPLLYDRLDALRNSVPPADLMFTDRNSSFGIFLREFEPPRLGHTRHFGTFSRWFLDWPFILLFRKHYVKMTTSATWVLLDGWAIGEELLDDLVDAIFVGGLHKDARDDYFASRERAKGGPVVPKPNEASCSDTIPVHFCQTNNWTYDQLANVFEVIHKFVRAKDSDLLRNLLAIMGFGVAVSTVMLKPVLEKPGNFVIIAVGVWCVLMVVLSAVWNLRWRLMTRIRRHALVVLLTLLPLVLSIVWAGVGWNGGWNGGSKQSIVSEQDKYEPSTVNVFNGIETQQHNCPKKLTKGQPSKPKVPTKDTVVTASTKTDTTCSR